MTYPSTVLADSPLGYWRLGETVGATVAVDSSGNSRDGAYGATAPTLGATSLIDSDLTNTAADFDGSTDLVDIPDFAAWDSTNISIDAWVKPASISGLDTIIDRDDGTTRQYQLRLNAGKPEVIFFLPGAVTVTAPSALAVGQKAYIAATWDGITVRLYVDAVQVASTANAGTLTTGTIGPRIGSHRVASNYFHGVIDEVAVYGTGLSAARVLAHFDAATGPPVAPPFVINLSAPAPSLVTPITVPPFELDLSMPGFLKVPASPFLVSLEQPVPAPTLFPDAPLGPWLADVSRAAEFSLEVAIAVSPEVLDGDPGSDVTAVAETYPVPTLVDGRPV